MSQKTYKLVSYNSSWALDCHRSQVDANQFISEAAAIIEKYVKLHSISIDGEIKKPKIENMFDKNFEYIPPGSNAKKISNAMSDKLDTFRKSLGDRCTEYFKYKITADNVDFIALIEQSIHVPVDHVANHDPGFMAVPFDLTNDYMNKNVYGKELNKPEYGSDLKNEDYGILRRLNKLNKDQKQILDLDSNDFESDNSKYVIVYDNVKNTAVKAAEGIGIVYKKSLITTPLEWNYGSLPLNKDENKDYKGKLYFYSDDLGPAFCGGTNGNPVRYVTARGTADFGRPIIITGGTNDNNELNLFIAAHGPNFLNLFKINDDGTKSSQLKDIKSDNQEYASVVKPMYIMLVQVITKFIEDSLESSINFKDLKYENINIFLGGDFNDAEGKFLQNLIEQGMNVKGKKVIFKLGNLDMKKNGQKGQYSNILTCCANKDSINIGRNTDTQPGTLGGIDEARYKAIEAYPQSFIDPKNFGYNGDYVVFGSSNAYLVAANNNIFIDQDINMYNIENISPSDHLPVVSYKKSEYSPVGGKQTRRRKNIRRRKTRARKHRKLVRK